MSEREVCVHGVVVYRRCDDCIDGAGDDGYDAGHAAGLEQGRAEGSTSERETCVTEAQHFHSVGALWPWGEDRTPDVFQKLLRKWFGKRGTHDPGQGGE